VTRLPWLFGSNERDHWAFQGAGWGVFALIAVLSSGAGSRRGVLQMVLVKLACVLTAFDLSHPWRLYSRRHGSWQVRL
jgi:hypothetical protein